MPIKTTSLFIVLLSLLCLSCQDTATNAKPALHRFPQKASAELKASIQLQKASTDSDEVFTLELKLLSRRSLKGIHLHWQLPDSVKPLSPVNQLLEELTPNQAKKISRSFVVLNKRESSRITVRIWTQTNHARLGATAHYLFGEKAISKQNTHPPDLSGMRIFF